MSLPAPTLSVIIPCWNDFAALQSLLERLRSLRGVYEIIVGDASCPPHADEVLRLCREHGAEVVHGLLANRGRQLNAAAAQARGDVLLFQHADTQLDQSHVDALLASARDSRIAGGGFYRKFDQRHPCLYWLEGVNRWINRSGGTIFGDQSIFVRREVFQKMGGFAEIALMEDVDFSKRLRKAGKVILLDPPLATSARRSARRGSWRTSVENGLLLLLFHLGVSPQKLHGFYYRNRLGAG